MPKLTNAVANDSYTRAVDALNKVIRASANTTQEQRDLAKEKRRLLTLEFIDQAFRDVEERTAKYQEFIDAMQALIDEFSEDTILTGLTELKEIVDEGKVLLESLSG